ncbi:hypothetical protein [Bacillus sp. D386]|uniref:hypothetical protein n=1 Tax=Bacillus sp. D386 TaxID=2587155 RepID=UPI001120F784|nr:hypothetical protein [Bacillus sp. D386]
MEISIGIKFVIFFPVLLYVLKRFIEVTVNNMSVHLSKYVDNFFDYLEKKQIGELKKTTVKIITDVIFSAITQLYFVGLALYRKLINPVWLISTFIITYSLFYYFIDINVIGTINFYEILRITNSSDNTTLYILEVILNIIRIAVPLSFPFFYFIYKEQKSISDSSVNGRTTFIYFTLFVLFSLLSAYKISSIKNSFIAFDEKIKATSLTHTHNNGEELAFIFLLIIFSLYFLSKLMIDSFRNLNLELLIFRKTIAANSIYSSMSFSYTIYNQANIYELLTAQVETIYQVLIQISNKNLGRVYDRAYYNLEVLLFNLCAEYRLFGIDTTTKHLYLLNKFTKEHLDFYKSLLKNHKELIIHLVQEHKIQDAKMAIKILVDMIPSATTVKHNIDYYNEYLATYYTILYELLIYLYENENLGLYTVIEKLSSESISKESVEREGIVRIIQSLIIKAGDKNDVKMLSTFSYMLSSFCQPSETNDTNKTTVSLANLGIKIVEDDIDEKEIQKLLDETGYKEFYESEDRVKKNENNLDLLYATVFIFLQALLKSIEITNYKTTGFLVKFLVTTFDDKVVNRVFNDFIINPYHNLYWGTQDFYKDIDSDFHMNPNVKDYLIIKLTILLYAQQKYIKINKVNFNKIPSNFIDINKLTKIEYLGYIFKKLEIAQKEYGLMFLQDDHFMNEIKLDFKYYRAKESDKKKHNSIILID